MSARRVVGFLVAFALVAACGAVRAQAVVEAVQYPAWLERGGARTPLLPGTVLQARDAILTGGEGRARMRLAEGSRVRLGAHARADLLRDELVVAAGAFRFIAGDSRGRDVALRVGALPVLARGADLFGQAGAPDHVVLVSGVALVTAGGASVALERPLDRYEAGAGASSRARGDVLPAMTSAVEMSPDGAGAEAGGRWRVIVGKFESGAHARLLSANVRAAGFPSEIVGGGGRSPHVVVVPGLAGESEARAAMARLRAIEGAGILTVSRSQ